MLQIVMQLIPEGWTNHNKASSLAGGTTKLPWVVAEWRNLRQDVEETKTQ